MSSPRIPKIRVTSDSVLSVPAMAATKTRSLNRMGYWGQYEGSTAAMAARIEETRWKRKHEEKSSINGLRVKTRSTRKSRNRRSMSDPNLQKNFQAIKNLWDTKVMNDPVAPKIFTANYNTNTRGSKSPLRLQSNSTFFVENKESAKTTEPKPSKQSPTKPNVTPKPPELTNRATRIATNTTETSPQKKSSNECNSLVMARAKMFESTPERPHAEINNNSLRSRQDKRTISDESIQSSSNKLYGSFNKVKPEDLSSRLKKRKGKNEEEKALLLNYQDEQESDGITNNDSDVTNENNDIIIHLSQKANLARERRSNSKRGSVASSDSESSCSKNSLSSVGAPTSLQIEQRNSPNKSFLHSPKSQSRNNSFTENNKADSIIKARASSLHKSNTFSSPEHKTETIPQSVSCIEINTVITPARKLSLTNLQRAARSSSVEKTPVTIDTDSPVSGSESPPQRRNSALHRKNLKKQEGEFNSTGISKSETNISSSVIQPESKDDSSIKTADSSSTPILSTDAKTAVQTRPVTIAAPIRPSRPAPPVPKAKLDSESSESQKSNLSVSIRTPDSVFNAEEEISKIMKEVEESSNRDSLEVPSNRSDNESISDFEGSDDDAKNINNQSLNQSVSEDSPALSKEESLKVKLHNIAKELLSTEESYVEILHLIDQVFHKQVTTAIEKKTISSDIKNIFSNVSAIYSFHSGFLLPKLQERLAEWESNPRIGDVMKQAAPFLKMYSLYVQNFDEAMNLIKLWSEKSSNFRNIITETQKLPECKSLSLQHHMLGPVQRIPRYKMLLEDYMKRLPEDSNDFEEASKALQLISSAATHSNETMRQTDRFQKLWAICNSLDIDLDLGVARELIMEGKMTKISARNGEKYERYLYLFSDMLLCCTPIKRIGTRQYKVNANLELAGMDVIEVKNMNIPNTFCVHGMKKSMDFAASSHAEKDKWITAITGAVEIYSRKLASFPPRPGSGRRKNSSTDVPDSPKSTSENLIQPITEEPTQSSHDHLLIEIDDEELGKRAPRWIKDNEVTLCMFCSKKFHQLKRRRHHCRACGRVICHECSEHKLELQYEPGKHHKVCTRCFDKLTGKKNKDGEKKGVLQVTADTMSEKSVISEYLFFNDVDKKKGWIRRWCVIPNKEPCLYIYGAHQDVKAAMTMPLIGFKTEDIERQSAERDFCLKLKQATKTFLFSAESEEQKLQWKYVFEECSRGLDVTREGIKNATASVNNNNIIENPYDEIQDDQRPNSSISTVSDNSMSSENSH